MFSRLIPTQPFGRPHRLAVGAGAAIMLLTAVVWAAVFQHVGTHKTSKTPEQAWAIMTAYSETCASGCKYTRPNLVSLKQLDYGRAKDSWYTWTHVGNSIKDAKFFTHVKITRRPDGNFISENRQLDRNDKALIKKLEASSGLKHSPVFDGGATTTITRSEGDKTVITQTITVHTGALVGLWEGRIRSEMKKNMDATFRNIGK